MSTLAAQSVSGSSIFASAQAIDFSSQGTQVLAAAYALGGFDFTYQTSSTAQAKSLGQLSAGIVGSQAGGRFQLSGNLVLTDFNGNGAAPTSQLQMAALALLGSSNAGVTLLTQYGLASGQSSPVINVGSATVACPFIAGFSAVSGTGQSEGISGLTVKTGFDLQQGDLTLSASLSAGSDAISGTVDVGLLAFTPGSSFDVQPATFTWGSPNEMEGMQGSWYAEFTIPPGKSRISAVIPLLQTVAISYDDDSGAFETVSAVLTNGPHVEGTYVSGTYVLNIYDHDLAAHKYIDSSSSLDLMILMLFA